MKKNLVMHKKFKNCSKQPQIQNEGKEDNRISCKNLVEGGGWVGWDSVGRLVIQPSRLQDGDKEKC